MRRKLFSCVLLGLALLMPLNAMAKKKQNTVDKFSKGTGTIYMFGVSQMLADSVIYITTINQVDSIDLEKKTKMLPFRSDFSLQLKEYMEGQQHLKHQTTCVFFAEKRKKLAKKQYKVKKRYLDNPDTKIVMLDEKSFTFRHPLDFVANE